MLFINTNAQNYNLKIITEGKNKLSFIKKTSYKKTFKDSLNLLAELQKIKSKLLQKGYISASFDSIVYDSTIAKAYLFTGKQYTIQQIKSQGVNHRLIHKLNISEHKLLKNKLSPNELFELYERLIEYYENNGYPFASISPKNVSVNNGEIILDLEINKRQLIKINKFIIKGKSKISETYLKRHLSIFKGDVYNESIISEINNKLNNLSFVSQIRKPEIDFYGNKADVYIYLKNKKANNFNGVIGFIADKENDYKLSFTGNISIKLLNNFKRGEEMFLEWQRTKKLSQKLYLGASIPFLFKSSFGTNFNFKLDKIDTTYMTVFANFGIDYSFKNTDKIIAYLKNTSSYILSAKNIDTTAFKNVKALAFGIAYKTQKIDFIYNPSKGYSFLVDIASGNRKINTNSNKFLEAKANIDFYIPIFNKFIYKISSQNKFLFSSETFFQNELYKVGGFNSIRGFDEDAFYTSNLSVLTNEIRFLYERKSNVYLFSDIARIQQQKDNVLLFGFGVGTNFNTRAGTFSISYALGKIGNNPIQISNSKIHLGYINRF